jgi:hypothetical protein
MKRDTDIDKELFEILGQATPKKVRNERRNRFGKGLVLLSPFCVSVAFFPWPSANLIDKLMWLGYGLALLAIGAWQIDRSNRPAPNEFEVTSNEKDGFDTAKRLRRVK